MDFKCSKYRKNFASCRNKCFYFFRNNVKDIKVPFSNPSRVETILKCQEKNISNYGCFSLPRIEKYKILSPVVTWWHH